MATAKTTKEQYGIRREIGLPFQDALSRTREALKNEGFGVLTEIDMKAKLKEKLDKDFREYVILGACNPGFAYEALEHDIEIGLLLPCNVIVFEGDDGTVVSAIDPEKAMSIAGDPAIEPIAEQVGAKLRRAIDSI